MRVTVERFSARTTETVTLPAAATGLALLRTLGLAPDAHLLVRAETPIPLDEILVDGETLGILSAVSGGSAGLPNY